MSYNHGITMVEKPTSIDQPSQSLSAVQVAFGTAPINLAKDPKSVINEPILVRSFEEAKEKLGYSEDWENYTLCEVMDLSFKQMKVSPIVFVNVLDPKVHKESVEDLEVNIINKEALLNVNGVILSTLVVKSSDAQTNYEKDKDYISAFDQEGNVVISILDSGGISGDETSLLLSYDKVDGSKVTTEDIIGGYDASTNQFTGIETTQVIYPKLGVVPNILIAPGYSHEQEVGATLTAKSTKINGSFNATNILDLVGKTKEDALEMKNDALYNDSTSIVGWPKAKVKDKTYWLSTFIAGTISRTDADSESVPYKSPSNKRVPITTMVNEDGEELFLDQVQGNVLNAKGVVTAINMNGFRLWGNNTAKFDADEPGVMDPKDRFIPVRRMFDWWGNTFIINYFNRVDEPTNYRLIESVVDSENIRANGFQARGQIAGAHIEFRQEDNPVNDILEGRIKFIQKIAFFPPAENIINELEFDPTILMESLFGGDA